MPLLPVNEIFKSIQGEGFFTGSPAVFIRLQGCDVRCSFCDTKYAMDINPDYKSMMIGDIAYKKKESPVYCELNTDALINFITKKYPAPVNHHIVLTGGEPFLHEIDRLITELVRFQYFVQVETSGCHPIEKQDGMWITMSPKQCTIKEHYQEADELKYIVNQNTDFDKIGDIVHPYIYLQPESMKVENVKLCVDKTIEYGFRLSLQTHKLIGMK